MFFKLAVNVELVASRASDCIVRLVASDLELAAGEAGDLDERRSCLRNGSGRRGWQGGRRVLLNSCRRGEALVQLRQLL